MLLELIGTSIGTLKTLVYNFDKNGINSEIIVGSIRKDRDIVDSWTAGGHIVTAGYNLFPVILQHPMTDYSVKGFLDDFKDWIM